MHVQHDLWLEVVAWIQALIFHIRRGPVYPSIRPYLTRHAGSLFGNSGVASTPASSLPALSGLFFPFQTPPARSLVPSLPGFQVPTTPPPPFFGFFFEVHSHLAQLPSCPAPGHQQRRSIFRSMTDAAGSCTSHHHRHPRQSDNSRWSPPPPPLDGNNGSSGWVFPST